VLYYYCRRDANPSREAACPIEGSILNSSYCPKSRPTSDFYQQIKGSLSGCGSFVAGMPAVTKAPTDATSRRNISGDGGGRGENDDGNDADEFYYEEEEILSMDEDDAELYEEESLLSTIWEESSKDASRMGESLASKLRLQATAANVSPSKLPLRKIPRRPAPPAAQQIAVQEEAQEQACTTYPSVSSSMTTPPASPINAPDARISSSGSQETLFQTTAPTSSPSKRSVFLGSFVESTSNHSQGSSSPEQRKRTHKLSSSPTTKCTESTTSITKGSSSSSSPTKSINTSQHSQQSRVSLDSYLSDSQHSRNGGGEGELHKNNSNHKKKNRPPGGHISSSSRALPLFPGSDHSSSSDSIREKPTPITGSGLGNFLESQQPPSTNMTKEDNDVVTLVNLFTGEEVVVPEDDDEFTYVSYLSDGTLSTYASADISTTQSLKSSSDRPALKRHSSLGTQSLGSQISMATLSLDRIMEDDNSHIIDEDNDNNSNNNNGRTIKR
jgi:hypothetical protein